MVGIFLQVAQSRRGCRTEVFGIGDDRPSDTVVFDIVPNIFIRVEFWRVGREIKELELALHPLQACFH